jgi:hypothetical protein
MHVDVRVERGMLATAESPPQKLAEERKGSLVRDL